jgi:hypothetical protein
LSIDRHKQRRLFYESQKDRKVLVAGLHSRSLKMEGKGCSAGRHGCVPTLEQALQGLKEPSVRIHFILVFHGLINEIRSRSPFLDASECWLKLKNIIKGTHEEIRAQAKEKSRNQKQGQSNIFKISQHLPTSGKALPHHSPHGSSVPMLQMEGSPGN